ncbi:MAG: hypothetical protein HY718_01485 [Planctomycetes bacterium]|nr:hypothetical protein [Planctomycetota bacterium]
MSSHSDEHGRTGYTTMIILGILPVTIAALTADVLAADLKPPPPDPAKPVNYIEWLNKILDANVKENAADVYGQAFAKMKPLEGDWGDTLDGPWSDNKSVSGWLAANREGLALYRKASAMHECFFQIDDPTPQGDVRMDHLLVEVLLPSLQSHRDATKGLIAEGYQAWARGDFKTLPTNAIVVLRAAHHLDTGPSLMHRLAATASYALAYGTLRDSLALADDPSTLAARILAELKTADPPRSPTNQAYFMERIIVWDLCQRLFVPRGLLGGWTLHKPILNLIASLDNLTPAQLQTVAQAGPGPVLDFTNLYFDAIDEWVAKPYHLAAAETDHLDRMPKTNPNPLVQVLIGSLLRSRTLDERATASRRATRLVAHILVYHGRTSTYPTSLDDLKTAELKEIRADPFSGRDFVYRKQGTSFVLYSAAENLKDDTGHHDESWKDGDFVFWPVQSKLSRPPPTR